MKHIVTSNLDIVTKETLTKFIHDTILRSPSGSLTPEYLADNLMAEGYCSVIEITNHQQIEIPND